jgi:hypothetical protein
MTEFFDSLQSRLDVLRGYRDKLNHLLAQDFNLVDLLHPDEYRLSALIAFLLDPNGGHGQRDSFLQRFLLRAQDQGIAAASALAKNILSGQEVHVALEESTRRNRRIDIVVSVGSAAIGIENKPWAVHQDAQLADYAADLQRYESSGLIYLAGSPGEPSEESLPTTQRQYLLDQHRYAEWTYRHELAEWLAECSKVCEADKICWLLRDFRSYALTNFGLLGGSAMLDEPEEREIVDFVMAGTPQRLHLAVGIHAAFEKIREEVIRRFARELVAALEKELPAVDRWQVDAGKLLGNPLGNDVGLVVRHEGWEEGIDVRLWADSYGPRDWWLGVQTPTTYSGFDALRGKLATTLGDSVYPDVSDFPWWRRFEGKWADWTLADWRQNPAVLALGKGGVGEYAEYLLRSLVQITRAAHAALRPTA